MQHLKYCPRPAWYLVYLLCFAVFIPRSQSQTVTQQFSNPVKIQVDGASSALLYPSTITVSGMPAALTGLRIGLNELIGLQADFDILLEGPDGTRVVLLSDVSAALTFALYDIDFDLEAERAWPGDMQTDVLFLPANVEDVPDLWPAPGPGAWQQPYPSLAAFEGKNPNGVWKLYVVDDEPAPYQLSVNKGWELRITAGNTLPCTRPGTPYLVANTPFSATAAWAAHGGVQWEVFYAPDSLAKPEASTPPTIGNVGNSTLTLNNLTPATRYVFYVRAGCGALKSKWIGPLHFRTPGDMAVLCNTASDISICSPVALSPAPGNAYTPAGCFSDGEGPESLYRFTAPATGEYTLYVEQGAGEAVRFLYKPESDGCTDQNWQCIYNGIHQYTGAFGPLQSGVTYYLMAERTNAVSPDFRFSLSPVGVVTNIGLHHMTDRYAVLSWAWSDQLSTDLVYGPTPFTPNASTAPAETGVTNNQYHPIAPFMAPDTDYQIYLRRRNGAETGCWAGPLTVKTLPTCGAVTDISVSAKGLPPFLHFKSGNATTGTFAYTVGPAPYPFPIEGLIDPLTIITLQGPDFKTHFDNLQIGQTYQCYVKKVCGGGLDPQAWYGPHTFTVSEKCPPGAVAAATCGGPALTVETYSEFVAPFTFGCMSQPGFGWGGSGFVQFTPTVTGVYGFQQKNPVLPPGGVAGPVQYAIRRLGTPCIAASWRCIEELDASDTGIFYTDTLLAGVTYQVMLTPMRYSLQSIDFQIAECPNDCPPVSGLVATVQNGGTQIGLQWSADAAHDNFLLRYGRADQVKGPEHAGAMEFTTTATTATLTGLSPNELYKIWIRGSCNAQKGPWVAAKPVHTAPVSREIAARVTTCSPWCMDVTHPGINYFDTWIFQVDQSGAYRVYADFPGFNGRINLFEDSIATQNCISNQIETAAQPGRNRYARIDHFLEAGKKYILQFSTNRPVTLYQGDFDLGDGSVQGYLLGPAPVTAAGHSVFKGLSAGAHGSPPQWGALTVEATHSCLDTAGWTHYYHEGSIATGYAPDDVMVLSLKQNDNDIGDLTDQTLTVRHVTPGNIVSPIKNPPALYVTNPKGWFVMGPFWQVIPKQQPATDVSVRFYFPYTDFLNFQNFVGFAGATPPAKPEDLFFYKINGAYDPNPANGHAGIPAAPGYDADGFWQYANGPAATDSTWRLGTNANGDFYGETVVARFSGGGGGAGGGPGGAFTVSVKTFYPEENQPDVFPVPATDAVYIRWKTAPAQNSPYRIFNSDGRLMQSGRLGQDGQETVEIGAFPAGVYLLWIKTERGAMMYRLVKI